MILRSWEGEASLQVLRIELFPDEIVKCLEEEILAEIRKEVKWGVGLKKVRQIQDVSRSSIQIIYNYIMVHHRNLGLTLKN